MASQTKRYTIELDERELRIIIEMMRFSLDYCPVEGICPELNIAEEDIETLATKLESVLATKTS